MFPIFIHPSEEKQGKEEGRKKDLEEGGGGLVGRNKEGKEGLQEERGLGECRSEEGREEASFYFWLSSMHSVLIGPGLGRSVTFRAQILEALEKGKGRVVLDADAFWHILKGKEREELVEIVRRMGRRVVLTPNRVEAGRLIEGFLREVIELEGGGEFKEEGGGVLEGGGGVGGVEEREGRWEEVGLVEVKGGFVKQLTNLSKFFGGAVVLCKGERDLITDGEICWAVREPGCWKRSGGKTKKYFTLLPSSLTPPPSSLAPPPSSILPHSSSIFHSPFKKTFN